MCHCLSPILNLILILIVISNLMLFPILSFILSFPRVLFACCAATRFPCVSGRYGWLGRQSDFAVYWSRLCVLSGRGCPTAGKKGGTWMHMVHTWFWQGQAAAWSCKGSQTLWRGADMCHCLSPILNLILILIVISNLMLFPILSFVFSFSRRVLFQQV